MSIKKIAALVSAGRHPVSGEARHCRNDSLAMSIGLTLTKKINAISTNASITNQTSLRVMHAGNPDNAALKDYLALGAKHIDVIALTAECNIIDSLANELTNTDLILTGSRAENGQDSGLVPYLLAEKLGFSLVANVLEVKLTSEGLEVLQFLPKGKRRSIIVQLPAVVIVHPLAPVELRHAYAQQVMGNVSQQQSLPFKPVTDQDNSLQWQKQSTLRKPIKLKARENKSGHARMLSATVSENKGGAVVIDGDSVEKAQVILRYLREHRLINF
jgi:electron transfer flavoprotein beta subunit